ncbi:anhydro-N-acetylmuramic acid kinase [Polaribacter porphyrae]|uniref:Anhydro-N-acetylmuramic acid kinase n=1 Tax=Polaribacter porphyrae TaxID=1137780 RepID=A0A2S7WJF0_9FLAO|nr:anhydro-N-acetylmuramic acid kinase [Polaribacter porphyrae]PQJ77739.1 anhydro-N-acetylmuramic acid kinase [Polaribacter porphyrae]
MIKKEVFSVGVMSGTSLDGVDLVYVKFDEKNYQKFHVIDAITINYSKRWKQTLQTAIHFSKDKLEELDTEYGRFLGKIINQFIIDYKVTQIDFIASHGHTILHQPEDGITLQIGSGEEIAKITNQKVVYDFRTQDVKLGGQGAPLVPIGDELLFSNYDFCLNLGGFSNISFKKNNQRIAFDICPANIVLNYYTNKIGLEYDKSGKIASEGKINDELLEGLNALEFYKKEPPKSLGLEWVQQDIFPLIDKLETNIPSILRTFAEHIAIQIGKVIYKNDNVLITGGGAFNDFLIQRIQFYAKITIELPSKKLINFKEAFIFSFLGLLKINNEINCLKSVTGASKSHSSGVVVNP